MNEKGLEKPRLHKELLEAGDLKKNMNQEEYISNVSFEGDFIETAEVDRIHFDSCYFHNVIFSECHFPHIDMLDCVFDHCDFSNIDCSEGSIHRCQFEQCRMTGSDFSDCVIHNTSFIKNIGKYINFSFSKFKQVMMLDDDFNSGGFNGCEFKKTAFENCNLNKCEFINAALSGVNWMTCTIEEIMITIDNVKGLTVSSDQAVDIARLFGLTIK